MGNDGKITTFMDKTMNMTGWAKHYNITLASLSYAAKKRGSITAALKYMELQNKRTPGFGIHDIWEYTGEEFVLENGNTVIPGMVKELCEWSRFAGVAVSTLKNRMIGKIASQQEAFNQSIIQKTNGHLDRMRKYPACQRKVKKITKTSMQILQCRQQNPNKRCSDCEQKSLCY